MTKPHEQSWRVGRRVPRHIYRADDDSVVGTLDREEDARMAAVAPEMARMLVRLEWAGHEGSCPMCGCSLGSDPSIEYGHEDYCELEVVLRKAGIR